MSTKGIAENQFLETELNVSAKRTENLFRILFMVMAGLLILPVLIILTTLVVKGGSIISFDKIFNKFCPSIFKSYCCRLQCLNGVY